MMMSCNTPNSWSESSGKSARMDWKGVTTTQLAQGTAFIAGPQGLPAPGQAPSHACDGGGDANASDGGDDDGTSVRRSLALFQQGRR
jgi:hypothetical protein